MILLLLIVFVLLILNPDIVAFCVLSTSKLWLYKLVPILYPSFILVDFLSNDFFLYSIGFYLFPYFKKILGIHYPTSILILFLAVICGAPSSTKLIKLELEKGTIDIQEGKALFYSFSYFSLPYCLFILNLFSISIFSYYLFSLSISFLFFRILNKEHKIIKYYKKKKKEKKNYLKFFFSSISKNINILLSILGIMLFFNILLSLLNIHPIIYSYFEVLSGHQILLSLNINKKLKDFILLTSLNFLGISSHFQILFVSEIKYLPFFLIKGIQAILLGSIFLIL